MTEFINMSGQLESGHIRGLVTSHRASIARVLIDPTG